MKNLNTNSEVKKALETYILWGKEGRDEVKLFTGTFEECTTELENEYDSEHPNYSISKNEIKEQWENTVEGRGFVIMQDGSEFEYSKLGLEQDG